MILARWRSLSIAIPHARWSFEGLPVTVGHTSSARTNSKPPSQLSRPTKRRGCAKEGQWTRHRGGGNGIGHSGAGSWCDINLIEWIGERLGKAQDLPKRFGMGKDGTVIGIPASA